MPFASSNTAKIHYSVKEPDRDPGRPTVLLLMGLGGHATEWGEPFLAALSEHYRVITMDNRGIGQSTSDSPSWSLEDMAHDALAVFDAAGCSELLLAGHSMGGMISQLVATIAPGRIRKLALMSTTFGGRESLPPTAEASALFAPAPELTRRELQRRALEVLTAPGFADSHPELIEELAALRERDPTAARVFQTQVIAIMNSDRSARVRNVKMPTLILHGHDDQLIPVENGRRLAARIDGSKLVLFEHCGHFPHLELPERTAAELHEFFG